jgi:hypothetical protein
MTKTQTKTLIIGLLVVLFSTFSQAQQSPAFNNSAIVPPLVKFSGTLSDVNGKPLSGIVGITFALYKDEEGGSPLWLETQNATLDKSGHYTVMLGSTSSTGLPSDIFVAGEARWLAAQAGGQPEQPRVLLLSVPYALKAGDAQTLGGLPASAFVQMAPGGKSGVAANTVNTSESKAAVTATAITGTGKTNYVPMWTSSTNLGESLIYQTGTAIGINTTTPDSTVDVKGNNGSEVLHVTQSGIGSAIAATANGASGSAILATTSTPTGVGVSGTASSTTSSAIGGVGVFGFSSNPIGYGVQGTSGNVGVYGTGGTIGGLTGIGVQGGGDQYGVYGSTNSSLFPANQAGVFGTTASASSTAYGVEGRATATSGSPIGVFGSATSAAGYGVYGSSTNVGVFGNGTGAGGIGVDGHGPLIGVKGIATASGGLSGSFGGGPVLVGGNGNNALIGDPGCGAGYAGLGFTTGSLSGCTNYAILGGPGGGTFINANGTAFIHFRSNNNELATIDNAGNVNVIGINGGGNMKVSGKLSSSNVIAAATASNATGTNSSGHNCTGTLSAPNSNCIVPNMTLTKTTANPNVLVMVNIGGVSTDQCVTANFYLVVDNKIVALHSVSYNSNNSAYETELSDVTMLSLQDLAAGSHTFEVQEADDQAGANCSTFTLATGVSQGDGGRGSQRSLIVREF